MEALAIGLLCLIAIGSLLSGPNLNPDSTSYITAASNFVETGRLFVFVNTPSTSMSPRIEPYTEQPPGFPLYLAAFVFVFRDPILSALIAQTIAIAFFFIAIYFMAVRIRLNIVLRIQALLIVAFLNTIRQINSTIWTETLFISLSLAAGVLALGIYLGDKRRFSWPALVGSLALASSLRLVGVANAVWLAPMLFRQETIQEFIWLLRKRSVTRGLIILGALLIGLSVLVDVLLFSREFDIGGRQILGIALGGAVLLTGIFGIQLRRLNKGNLGTDTANPSSRDGLWSIAAAIAAIAPVVLWLARNKLMFGEFTLSHRLLEVRNLDRILAPLEYVSNELFDVRIGDSLIPLLIVAAFWLVPFFIGSSRDRKIHVLIISVTAAHLFAVWLPSLIARFDTVGARLLSPAVALGILVTLHGIQVLYNRSTPKRWRYGLLVLPVMFLVIGKNFQVAGYSLNEVGLNYPPEKQLWSEIRELEEFKKSTHFYSDPVFEHQIFAGMPQRIIWERTIVRDPELLTQLLSKGQRPFILLSDKSPEAIQLAEFLARVPLELSKIEFPTSGYTLYYGDF